MRSVSVPDRHGYKTISPADRSGPDCTLVTKMRPPNPELAIGASELALRLVELSFPPSVQHTPGVGHALADALSRVYWNRLGSGIVWATRYYTVVMLSHRIITHIAAVANQPFWSERAL